MPDEATEEAERLIAAAESFRAEYEAEISAEGVLNLGRSPRHFWPYDYFVDSRPVTVLGGVEVLRDMGRPPSDVLRIYRAGAGSDVGSALVNVVLVLVLAVPVVVLLLLFSLFCFFSVIGLFGGMGLLPRPALTDVLVLFLDAVVALWLAKALVRLGREVGIILTPRYWLCHLLATAQDPTARDRGLPRWASDKLLARDRAQALARAERILLSRALMTRGLATLSAKESEHTRHLRAARALGHVEKTFRDRPVDPSRAKAALKDLEHIRVCAVLRDWTVEVPLEPEFAHLPLNYVSRWRRARAATLVVLPLVLAVVTFYVQVVSPAGTDWIAELSDMVSSWW